MEERRSNQLVQTVIKPSPLEQEVLKFTRNLMSGYIKPESLQVDYSKSHAVITVGHGIGKGETLVQLTLDKDGNGIIDIV